jgi:hypothetical protein
VLQLILLIQQGPTRLLSKVSLDLISNFDFAAPGRLGTSETMYDYNSGPSTFDQCGSVNGPRFCSPPPPSSFVPSSYGLAPSASAGGQQFVQRFFPDHNHHLVNGAPGPSSANIPTSHTYMNGLLSPNLPQNASNAPATSNPSHLAVAIHHIQPQMHHSPSNGGPAVFLPPHVQQHHQANRHVNMAPGMPYATAQGQQMLLHQQHQFPQQQQDCLPHQAHSTSFMCCPPQVVTGDAMGNLPPGFFYRNRMPGVPPPPPQLPQYFGLDYKIYELNKRLQHRSEVSDFLDFSKGSEARVRPIGTE